MILTCNLNKNNECLDEYLLHNHCICEDSSQTKAKILKYFDCVVLKIPNKRKSCLKLETLSGIFTRETIFWFQDYIGMTRKNLSLGLRQGKTQSSRSAT